MTTCQKCGDRLNGSDGDFELTGPELTRRERWKLTGKLIADKVCDNALRQMIRDEFAKSAKTFRMCFTFAAYAMLTTAMLSCVLFLIIMIKWVLS